MSFRTLFARDVARQTRRETPGRRPATARPWLEPLEERSLLSNYTLTDLRSLAGFPCEARDLNAFGQVVGTTYDPNAGHQPEAVLWDGSVVTNLGTLGGMRSSASAINDLGQIVGYATKLDGSYRGFLINPEDSDGDNTPDRWYRDLDGDGANDLMVELPLQAPRGINGRGQVIGSGIDDNGNYLWTPNTPNGTTGSLLALGLYPTAINDAGQIAGSASIDGWGHAVLWQGGVTTDLGYGNAEDINASGQVVGYSDGLARGFLWTPDVPNGTIGTFNYMESLFETDTASFALSVNNAGQVVGKSLYVFGGEEGGVYEESRATLWAGDEPQSLSNLVVPDQYLIGARAINNSGQIVAHKFVGAFDRSDYPVLLTPITVPLVTIGDVTVTESNTGTRAATFTVTLSAASSQPVTVVFATANGSASAGSDYQATSGTLTIPAGETTGTITVLVNGDRLAEPNETFVVNLSSPTNATIADGQGVGTIMDDEPRISISDVSKKEGRRNQTTLFTFVVTLSTAYDQPVTMSFQAVNGTATASSGDYIAKTGTLTFAPGETTKTITIEVKGDSKKESNETFYLDLFGNSGNALFTKNRGFGTILNDD